MAFTYNSERELRECTREIIECWLKACEHSQKLVPYDMDFVGQMRAKFFADPSPKPLTGIELVHLRCLFDRS
jgi:hypothetical protein